MRRITNYQEYYEDHESEIELAWSEHLLEHHWGSGEDRIRITNDMFWEFVEKYVDRHNPEND